MLPALDTGRTRTFETVSMSRRIRKSEACHRTLHPFDEPVGEVQDASVAFRRYSGCDTEYSLECFAEGGIGIVANGFRHFEELLITFLQQSCSLLHSPTCQIFQRCFLHQVLEANRKSRTRHTACHSERLNRPVMLDLLVQGFESDTDLRIENRPQQAAFAGFRPRSDVGADRVAGLTILPKELI
jgi:hypothetical protein